MPAVNACTTSPNIISFKDMITSVPASTTCTANPKQFGGYKLQKNMSLSQLDEKIRQNVSREELYNLICNNEQPQSKEPRLGSDSFGKTISNISKVPSNIDQSSKNYHSNGIPSIPESNRHINQYGQIENAKQWNHMKAAQIATNTNKLNDLSAVRHPLSKSVSQISMPTMFNNFMRKKSPKKTTIPTLFKPLCKSTSNTHVFNRNYDVTDEPPETFTPKHLTKSSSSSSIFTTPSANYFNTIRMANNEHKKINQMATSSAINASHSKRMVNNTNTTDLFPQKPNNSQTNTATPLFKPDANQFFVKQNVPQLNKATVNYAPLKSKSSIHIPFYGNFPSSMYSNNSNATSGNKASHIIYR